MSFFNKIDLGFKNQKSPDGRLRTNAQLLLGDYKQFTDLAPGLFDTEVIGGGSFTYEGDTVGGTTLNVTTTGDAVIRQSYQWHNYYAGKPQKIELTASNFQFEANVVKRFGYFSSNTSSPYDTDLDGFFFQNDGTEITANVYRSGTQVFSEIIQPTGFDPADFNFYAIDFLYLGGAIAQFSILKDGFLEEVATYLHSGVDNKTFVKSPNQPIRYEIRSSAGAGSFNHLCTSVASEGISQDAGAIRSYNTNGTTGELTGLSQNNRYALLGVRHSDRQHIIDFIDLSIISTTNDDLLIEVFFGGSTAGIPPWAAIPFTYAEGFRGRDIIDAGSTSDAIHSGGVLIGSYYIQGNGQIAKGIESTRKLGIFLDGTSEEFYLCVTPLGNDADCYGSINWRELV